MNWTKVDIYEMETSSNGYDTLIERLMLGLLAFMPFAFGAVEAWSKQVVFVICGLMLLTFVVKCIFTRESCFVWTWAYVPLVLFLLVPVFQLIKLPKEVLEVIAPETLAVKVSLLKDVAGSGEFLQKMSLSFYPHATIENLQVIIAVATVFFIVVNVYKRQRQIKQLLGGIAIVGAMMALLCIAQIITGTDSIYWSVATGHEIANGGTFVNRNNYGQFMNLCIGGALGFILIKLYDAFSSQEKHDLRDVIEELGEIELRPIWYAAAFMMVGAASVFVSLTRGGMLSLLIAATFTALVLSTKKEMKGRNWLIAFIALCAFMCVMYISFDAVYERLATLQSQHSYDDRWQIVKDISVAWTRFPWFGTGLGSHEVVYPMFDRATISALASHAENEYAQVAEEMGIIGLSLLVVFGIIVWFNYFRSIRNISTPKRAAAFGLGLGLLAILIHSFSDFGQHMLANACLSAVFCGLLIALGRGEKGKDANELHKFSVVGIFFKTIVFVLVGGLYVWIVYTSNNDRLAEAYWAKAMDVEASVAEEGWLGSNEEYKELIGSVQKAAEHDKDNVKYHHWLNVYRWRAISRVTDPNTGELVMTDQTLGFTRRIVDELHKGRLLCPTFGPTYCLAGQLEYFILNDDKGVDHIKQGYELAPYDATTCFVAGLLDVQQGKIDDSVEKFERAAKLDSIFMADIIDVYMNQIDRPDLALELASDHIHWLNRIANELHDLQEDSDLVEKARTRAEQLLKEKCEEPDVPSWALASMARICVDREDYEGAIGYYSRAVKVDYGNARLHLYLARVMAKTGQIKEAIHEAKIALRLEPNRKDAKRLIEELSVLPEAVVY